MDVSIMGAGQAGPTLLRHCPGKATTLRWSIRSGRPDPRRRGNGKSRGGCRARSELLHYSRFREVAALAVHSAGTA